MYFRTKSSNSSHTLNRQKPMRQLRGWRRPHASHQYEGASSNEPHVIVDDVPGHLPRQKKTSTNTTRVIQACS